MSVLFIFKLETKNIVAYSLNEFILTNGKNGEFKNKKVFLVKNRIIT